VLLGVSGVYPIVVAVLEVAVEVSAQRGELRHERSGERWSPAPLQDRSLHPFDVTVGGGQTQAHRQAEARGSDMRRVTPRRGLLLGCRWIGVIVASQHGLEEDT
jgi:hypothetical protein